jgi:dipeptidyl-peptidase 4
VSVVDVAPEGQVQPRLEQFQYLKPEDTVRLDRPRLFDMTGKKEIATDSLSFSNPFSITNLGWSPSGHEYRFIYNERGQQVLRVVGIDTQVSARSIIEDTSDTFVDYSSMLWYHEMKNGDEMIWISE